MKKSLVALLLLISSKQILACDYYEDKSVISKTLDTGIYHKNISGVVCSPNKTMTIPIKNGKKEGLVKEYYESGALKSEVNFKDGIRVSGKCANGREWTDAELSNFEKGLEVSCGD